MDCVLHAIRGALLLPAVVHPRGRRPRLPEIPVVPLHLQLLPDLHDLLPRALLVPDDVPGRNPEGPRLGHCLQDGAGGFQHAARLGNPGADGGRIPRPPDTRLLPGERDPAQQQHPQPRGLAGGHEPTCLPPWCWAPSTASPVWFWFSGSGSSRLAPLWSSPRQDVRLQLLTQLSCTRTRWHCPPVPPIAAPATPLSLPRAPQPPGEGWAALHPLPEDDRGTQTLHPAALWLPLRLPGLPGHAGDFCFLLYPRCGAGREIPAFGARHAGHGFPLYPLLAVVFGEIWEENGSDGGPGGEFAPGCGCGLRSHALATRGGNKKVDRVAHQAQQWQEASCSSGTSQLLPGSAGKGQHSLQFGRAKRAAESARVLLFLLFLSLPQLIIPALVAITQVSHNFLAFVLLMMVAGCSMAVLYLLPWSMLPDAVDDFMLRNPSCLNLEALFYSFYVFFNKFAGGLAVGISTLGLHFAGYRAGDCTYNPSVTLALKLLMAPVPITLLLIAITLFCLHPINEERRKQMRTELEAMGRRQARHGSSEHHQG
eukprot:XP_027329049.1 uncharacterized protein LOC101804470 isoform X6 [Anas platyrhynchos]